ncbi:MAG: hypothetical protein JWP97_3796 [Labilithrix sp.]|nr:hypothetical protein [Labilithrix sp.]
MPTKRYIIIGDGAAGTTAAEALRLGDRAATIAILSDDPHAAYYRAALTNYLLGELREEQIWAVPPSFYDELAIHRALVRVARIDTQRRHVWLAQGGRPLEYDALVLGCGARARPPTFEGAWLPGIMTMRTLQDVHKVMDLIQLRGLRTAVITGGGPLALEWAHGLSHRGVNVVMVVRDTRFLPGAIDKVASDLLLARLRAAGVQVRMGEEIVAALPGAHGRVAGVALKSGERVACELVGVAIGVIVNSEFLEGSGVKLAKNGAIEVDERMRTNVPDVYAAGDCAAFAGKVLQLWEPARFQARVVAATIQHGGAPGGDVYAPGAHYMATRLYDLDCASIGEVAVTPPGAEELVDFPQRTGRMSYRKLCIKDGRLVGALMFGEREAKVRRFGRALKRLVDLRTDVTRIKHELLDPAFDLAAWLHQNALTEKPKAKVSSGMAAAAAAAPGKMKGTHAINLADLPPLPGASAVPVEAPVGHVAVAFDSSAAPVVSLEGPPGRIQVQPPSAILGRDPRSPIPLQDPGVSWRHAEITISGQHVYVRDLGSSTGTWVNGSAVTTPKAMRDGDRVRIGATELLVRIALEGGARMSEAAASLVRSGVGEPKPHLEVRTGRSMGLAFELVADLVVIGRDPASTIRLDDESIDWRHAWVRRAGAGWEVADAESHGITRKNGQVLAAGQWVPLAPGDALAVGEVTLAFAVRPSDMLSALLGPASGGRSSSLPGPPVRGRLSVRQGAGQGSIAELADLTVIGSQPGQATLLLPDPRVGPRHVEIARLADGFYLRDLGSQRGTSCRGMAIGPQPFKLAHGDIIVLGHNAVALLYEGAS